jgi:UDP-N-acetylmuramate dehydrogenase
VIFSVSVTSQNLMTVGDLQSLRQTFGERLIEGVSLARYSAARVGGMADYFIDARTLNQLVQAASLATQAGIPFILLGGGSNILVSDAGIRGLVILNRTRRIVWNDPVHAQPLSVMADSGVNFGQLARKAAERGLSGLEWAAGIPGTLGGAVYGNAGAHGADMSSNLLMAEILHLKQGEPSTREKWSVKDMDYGYRTSYLKRQPRTSSPEWLILSATLNLTQSTPGLVAQRVEELNATRRRTQPPGASMGSMFKNPPGDYAGRLIDAAGLKGTRQGGVEISPRHANFFVNDGRASAADIYALLELARRSVAEKFGVQLELEIELVGEWPVGVQTGK